EEDEIEAELGRTWMVERAWDEITERAWNWLKEEEYDTEYLDDDDEVRRLYIDHWLGKTGRYDMERLALEYVYARRAVLAAWLREQGYEPEDILAFGRGLAVEERVRRDQNARYATLVLGIEQVSGEAPPEGVTEEEL